MQDHESGVGALERWGPWQSVLEEVVAGCMLQLRKLDTALSDGGLELCGRRSTPLQCSCMTWLTSWVNGVRT